MIITCDHIVRDPGSEQIVESVPFVQQHVIIVSTNYSIELYHALWSELHFKEDPTLEWFNEWLARVPSLGCDCVLHFAAILSENPPRYDDWPRWTWEVHNTVNLKLNKPIISLKEAYGSYSITK